jgi:hypothetical protein
MCTYNPFLINIMYSTINNETAEFVRAYSSAESLQHTSDAQEKYYEMAQRADQMDKG